MGAEDEDVAGTELRLFSAPIKLVRSHITPEAAALVPGIDFLRPPRRRSYTPFVANQIITGVQHYTTTVGDGAAREFAVVHGLASAAVHVAVRENEAEGRFLNAGIDYTVRYGETAADEVVVALLTAVSTPGVGGLAVLVSSAGPKSAFQEHEHTIAQVLGLEERLEAVEGRVDAIEELLPTAPPAVSGGNVAGAVRTIAVPVVEYIVPGRFEPGFDYAAAVANPAVVLPRRAPYLLAAWHERTAVINIGEVVSVEGGNTFVGEFEHDTYLYEGSLITDGTRLWTVVSWVTTPEFKITVSGADAVALAVGETLVLPKTSGVYTTGALPTVAGVYQNDSGATVSLPGGNGYRTGSVEDGGWFAYDGRMHYALKQDYDLAENAASSFYAPVYERELVRVPVNDAELRAGKMVRLEGELEIGLLRANTDAQIVLSVEVGTVTRQTFPPSTAENVQHVTWNTENPVLTQVLLLANLVGSHAFAVEIVRSAIGEFSSNKEMYGEKVAGGSEPGAVPFMLRARLHRFDTNGFAEGDIGEPEEADAFERGWVYVKLKNAVVRFA